MKHYDRSEDFVVDYGTSFPQNPKPGQLFRRTDLNDQIFQYEFLNSIWKPLSFDPKLQIPAAPTNKQQNSKASRGDIKAAAQSAASGGKNTVGPSRSTKSLVSTGKGYSVNPSKIQETSKTAARNSGEFNNGVYTPIEVTTVGLSVDSAPVAFQEFDEDGNFVNQEPCISAATNVDGIFIENSSNRTNPVDGCGCEGISTCLELTSFTVQTKADDFNIPDGCYKLTWDNPIKGFTNSTLWAFRLEAVEYPKDFQTEADWQWRGTVTRAADNKALAIVTGENEEGAIYNDRYAGKILVLPDLFGSCFTYYVISSNTTNTFYFDQAVSNKIRGEVDAYIIDAPWTYVDWAYDYRVLDDNGDPVVDRNADSFSYLFYTSFPKAKFRVCARNWWGGGPFQYAESYQTLYGIPDPPTFIGVQGELGTITVEVSGNAIYGGISGYELAYSTVSDLGPDLCPSGYTILFSESGFWTVSLNKQVTLFARTYINGVYSSWVAYGDQYEGPLYTDVVYSPIFGETGSPAWMQLQDVANPVKFTTIAMAGGGYRGVITRNSNGTHVYNGYINQPVSVFGCHLNGTMPFSTGIDYYRGFFLGLRDDGLTKLTGNLYFVGIEQMNAYNIHLVILAVHNYDTSRPLTENMSFIVDYEIARSENLHGLYGSYNINYDIERVGQTITARAGLGGDESTWQTIESTDDTHLVFSNEEKYIGFKTAGVELFVRDSTAAGTSYGHDRVFLIQSRNTVGYALWVDPGLAVDVLKANDTNEITSPFPVTDALRHLGGNYNSDYYNFSLDDNQEAWISIYNPLTTVVDKKKLISSDSLNLSNLSDVSIVSPSDLQILSYLYGKWVNLPLDIHYHDSLKVSPAETKVQVSSNKVVIGNLSFAFKRELDILNSGFDTIVNQQVCFTIDTLSMIDAGQIQPQGNDVRIVNSEGDPIPFWWEPETWDSTETKLWIRTDSIAPAGITRFYMLYGSSETLSPAWNGDLVFSFFDDFTTYEEGQSLNGIGPWRYGWMAVDGQAVVTTTDTANGKSKKCAYFSGAQGLFTWIYAKHTINHDQQVRVGSVGAAGLYLTTNPHYRTANGIPEDGIGYNNSSLYRYLDYVDTEISHNYACTLYNDCSWFYVDYLQRNNETEAQGGRSTPFFDGGGSYSTSCDITSVIPSGIADTEYICLGRSNLFLGNSYISWIFTKNQNDTNLTPITGGETELTSEDIVTFGLVDYNITLHKGLLTFQEAPADIPVPSGSDGTLINSEGDLWYVTSGDVRTKVTRIAVENLVNVSLDNLVNNEVLSYQDGFWVNREIETSVSASNVCTGNPFEHEYFSVAVDGDRTFTITSYTSGAIVGIHLNGVKLQEGEELDYVLNPSGFTLDESWDTYTGDKIIVDLYTCGGNLQGPKGEKGSKGDTGQSGYSGFSGASGLSGQNGLSGRSGFSGWSGFSGKSGFSGLGLSGYSGFSGNSTSGYSGFSGSSGISGKSGFSGTSGFSGPAGGPKGDSGYSGFSGPSGFSGLSGYSGNSGFSGTSGFSGPAGGPQGEQGVSGYSGFSGISGFSGGVGSAGTSGYSGFSGLGTAGGSGYSGFSGAMGTSGFSGRSGFSGTGTSGYSGFSGSVGNSGESGYSGFSGTSGDSGPQGTSGFSGINGEIGQSGYSGFSGSSGSSNFISLLDVPSSYAGQAGMIVAVNGAEDGLEFIVAPSGGTGPSVEYINELLDVDIVAEVLSNDSVLSFFDDGRDPAYRQWRNKTIKLEGPSGVESVSPVDVNISFPQDGDVLTYDAEYSTWINSTRTTSSAVFDYIGVQVFS